MPIYIVPGQTCVEGRGTVEEIGIIFSGFNALELIPVRFQDRTHAVMFAEGHHLEWAGQNAKELNDALRNSSSMPEITTMGSGIIYIHITDCNNRKGCIRYHFSFGKEDREDFLRWE